MIMLLEVQVFVTMKGTVFGDLIFDSTDGLIHSPRHLAMFTVSFLSGCTVNKALHSPEAVKVQSWFVRHLPNLIALLNGFEQVANRNFVYTVDDYLFMMVFCISLQIETDRYRQETQKSEITKVKASAMAATVENERTRACAA